MAQAHLQGSPIDATDNNPVSAIGNTFGFHLELYAVRYFFKISMAAAASTQRCWAQRNALLLGYHRCGRVVRNTATAACVMQVGNAFYRKTAGTD